jgi:hypothetical protein
VNREYQMTSAVERLMGLMGSQDWALTIDFAFQKVRTASAVVQQ